MIHKGDPTACDEDIAWAMEWCQDDEERELVKLELLRPYIGYWYSHEHPDLPDPRKFVDEGWDASERNMVVEHLRSGKVKMHYLGGAECRICGQMLGGADVTDGDYVWPEKFEHYLEEHDVRVPEEFVEHVRRSA